jgi:DEAD/DEAH box helicase domain-containing protein
MQKFFNSWQEFETNAELRLIPKRNAQFSDFPEGFHPELIKALGKQNIHKLYTHQAEAIQNSLSGKNSVVVTGVASGKSMCYNLPVLQTILSDPNSTALYLFPTKALTNDQYNNIEKLIKTISKTIGAGVYDGDTPSSSRKNIRDKANIILSNPDMLNVGILPHHTQWFRFLKNLKWIIIDEIHMYRGIFGSHIANLIRRVKRICKFYNSSPNFILTSATINNPTAHAERLCDTKFELIDKDGSSRGEKYFYIYNPPIVNEELGIRRSSINETVRIGKTALDSDLQTLIFAGSRKTVEILLNYLRHKNEKNEDTLKAYRSGYLSKERRKMENDLREGILQGVVATNALEAGIDIGGIDAVVMCGFPGRIASVWQQAGRAGRGHKASIAILITSAAPLDQFVASHPEYMFESSPENAYINPDNLRILLSHIRSAAFELPFKQSEDFGSIPNEQVDEILHYLQEAGDLVKKRDKYYWMADKYPSAEFSLRSSSVDIFNLVIKDDETDSETIIGKIDKQSAYWLAHPRAIYLQDGMTYFVKKLDHEQKQAILDEVQTDYYTEAMTDRKFELLQVTEKIPRKLSTWITGDIMVYTKVTGFRRIKWHSHEILGHEQLEMPEQEMDTNGFWIQLSQDLIDKLIDANLWNNQKNNYGKNWETIKQQIRKRDNFACVECGIAEDGKAHDVHHKVPFKMFTDPKIANDQNNLVTLCKGCHRKAEINVKVNSGLAGVTHLLHHLIPLYLMCDYSDIGVFYDLKSELADMQPTIILYDNIPGGLELTTSLMNSGFGFLTQALNHVKACTCEDGCPSCVGPVSENGVGAKKEAIAILEYLQSEE